MISIPQHARDVLTKDTNENPNDIPLQVLATSDKTIYLWFNTKNTGFIIDGNEWLHKNMAQASEYDKNKSLPFKTLPLQAIKLGDVKVYNDHSLAWTEDNSLQTAAPSECKEKLKEWESMLTILAGKPWTKITMRSNSIYKMAAALRILIQQLP